MKEQSDMHTAIHPAMLVRMTSVHLRTTLGLNQQAFASLLGLSTVTVNRWEVGKAKPTGLTAALLALLGDAIASAGPAKVLVLLRTAPDDASRLRALVRLGDTAGSVRPSIARPSAPDEGYDGASWDRE